MEYMKIQGSASGSVEYLGIQWITWGYRGVPMYTVQYLGIHGGVPGYKVEYLRIQWST